ncbi:MAG: hypothetical protein OEO17_16370 [Gemmatimonadota bacterium]|nr:hypothetical protein [Gemmatimonadota bacterium]
MSTARRCLTVLLTVTVAAACGGKQTASDVAQQGGAPELTLVVKNFNFNDATVYALGAGRRERLGRVPGNGEERFTFRWTSPDIRMEVDFLSGGEETTESMPVVAGDVLELVIEQSSVRPLRRVR